MPLQMGPAPQEMTMKLVQGSVAVSKEASSREIRCGEEANGNFKRSFNEHSNMRKPLPMRKRFSEMNFLSK